MIGLRVGIVVGASVGVACGVSADELGGTPKTLVLLVGQSNANAVGLVSSLTNQTYGDPYPNVLEIQKQSGGPTDPMVWTDTPLGSLDSVTFQAADRIGLEVSALRDLDSVLPGKFALARVAIYGTSLATHWNPAGTFPSTESPNLFNQTVAFGVAAARTTGCSRVLVMWEQGGSDGLAQGSADNYTVALTALEVAFKAGITSAGLSYAGMVFGRLNAATDIGQVPWRANVIASQNAYAALAVAKTTMVSNDAVALSGDGVHYTSDGYVSVGHNYAGGAALLLGVRIQPTASFTSSTAGLDVTFTDRSISPGFAISSWLWTFGDGSTSTSQSPVKTYAGSGSYSVTLKITNAAGDISTTTPTTVVVSGLAVTSDATSGAYLPATGTEWTAMIGNIGNAMSNPDEFWRFGNLASGNAIGVNGLLDLVTSNSPLYQQTVTGWSTKAVAWGDGTTKGFVQTSADVDCPNMGTDDVLILMYALVAGNAATRNILHLGTPSTTRVSIDALSTTAIRGFNATTTATGASNPYNVVRPYVLKFDRTNSTFRVYTDQEKISPAFNASSAGQAIAIGSGATGGSPFTSAAASVLYMAMWKGAGARASDAQIKSLITGLGHGLWTPPWS